VKLRTLTSITILILTATLIRSGLQAARAQPPVLSIYQVQRTDDPSGNSPYLDRIVTVSGIVTALDPGPLDALDGYFIEDPGAGPWSGIYVADPSGNRPALGDQVQVTGRVAELEGLTAITELQEFTVLSNNNPLPPAYGVTTGGLAIMGEPWEGVLVAVHSVTVIDANPDEPLDRGEWLVVDVSGAPVRVDDLTEGYTYQPVEGDELAMVRGVVFFADGAFKIEPRDDGDILLLNAFTSIREIQFVPEGAEDDASQLVGQQVVTAGVVTGVFPSAGYFIEDPRGGPWNGIWVREEKETLPPRGAYIQLKGTVAEFFGRTQLENVIPDSVIVHSVENPLPIPSRVSTADIGTGRPDSESYEGVLVRVGPVTVVNANPDAPDDFGEWLIADTSGVAVRVGALGDYTYEPVEGDELAYVQGPLDFTFGDRKIEPRDDDDIGTQPVTIAQARSQPLGTPVTVEGVVTVPAGLFDPGFAMQDGTSGIYVFHPSGFSQVLMPYQVVQVTGVLTEVNGLLEIIPADPATDVVLTGQSPPIRPLEVSTGDIGEGTEGWLVSIEGTVVARNGDTFTVDDGSGPAQVYIAPPTGIDISAITVGQTVAVVGFSGQFDPQPPFDEGYRIQPRFQNDVNPSGIGAVTPTPTITTTPGPPHYDLGTLFKNYGGCTSRYTVTNVANADATTYHELTSAVGTIHTLTDVVPAGESRAYDLATASYEPPLPESFVGAGVLYYDQPVTVVVQRCPQGGVALLSIQPSRLTVGRNGIADTGLWIHNVLNLYGIELHLAFDPRIVQVVDADPERAGVQIRIGAGLREQPHFVATNQVDNTAGTIDFVAALLSPASPINGNAELAVVTWQGANPGESAVQYTGVVLADLDGRPIAVTTQDGRIRVLEATATPTPSVTETPTSTPRPPTATPRPPTPTLTPTIVPTPTCDGGLCRGVILVRAYYDRACDGHLTRGLDHVISGAEVTLTYDNGASVMGTTDVNGMVAFGGINLPEGISATLSVRWPALTQDGFVSCPNSPETVTLTAADFMFRTAYIEFRAWVQR